MKTIVQFSYKYDLPPKLPVVDCRVITNPYSLASQGAQRLQLVRSHPLFFSLVKEGVGLLEQYDTIAVGCTYGRHRSGAVAEEISRLTGAAIVRRTYKG